MKKKILFLLTILLCMMSKQVFAETNSNVPLFRLYHSGLRVHLYTKDSNEYEVLGKRGWTQEGLAWVTAKKDGDVVYRLYHAKMKVHLYTKDQNEYKVLATRGWRQEGAAFYSEGTLPIYRLYHTGMRKHLYTKDKNEYKVLATRGWRQEGIAFYGLLSDKQQVTAATIIETKEIPFETEYIKDDTLFKDETKVKVKGVKGSIDTTFRVTYIDGIEAKRVKIKTETKKAINEVILQGTKDRITTKIETVREILPFDKLTEYTNTILSGQTKLQTKGEEGFLEQTYEITYTNGVETDRKVIKTNKKDPINEVTLIGALIEKDVDIWDPNYTTIPWQYIEDAAVPYGETRVVSEGRKAFYTIAYKNKFSEPIESKVLTPASPKIIAMHPGDLVLDKYGEKTLFKYMVANTEEQRFENASGNVFYASLRYYDFSSEEIMKLKAVINMDLVNQYFLELVNADRKTEGKSLVVSSEYGREIAGIRAQEQAEYGSVMTEGRYEVRPNGSDWKTVDSKGTATFEEVSSLPENIYELASEKYLAMHFYYNTWKKRIRPSKTDFTTVSLGLGLAKGELRNDSTSAFGRDEKGETVIMTAIAE